MSFQTNVFKNRHILTNLTEKCRLIIREFENMYKLYFEWKWEGHRVDSNHHRTGTIPIPSDLLKVDALIYFVGMVRYHQFESHAYRRILLSASSRASNVPLHTLKIHRGRLSATSPAHHRMAINHLLHRPDMMCFLALGATSYLT